MMIDKALGCVRQLMRGRAAANSSCVLPACRPGTVMQPHTSHACARVAKLAGDKRANVAEKSFGRPFSKVVIAESGLAQ